MEVSPPANPANSRSPSRERDTITLRVGAAEVRVTRDTLTPA